MSDSEDSLVEFTVEASENMDTLSDSDDSSVASNDDDTNANTSMSDSDDSFIVFADGEDESSNVVEETNDGDSSSSSSSVSPDLYDEDIEELEWDYHETGVYETATQRRERLEQVALLEEQMSALGIKKEEKKKRDNGKKVTFAEEPNLCTVHVYVTYSSFRFRMEIERFGRRLDEFLQPAHRQKVYEERFKDRQ